MIAVGEETGNLDTMLSKVADFYEDEVAAAVKALTSILEPVMIMLVGGIVGFIVVAMYMPMFKVYDAIVQQAVTLSEGAVDVQPLAGGGLALQRLQLVPCLRRRELMSPRLHEEWALRSIAAAAATYGAAMLVPDMYA